MCVYLEIALRLNLQVEQSMDGKMRKHMVQESNSRGDLVLSTTVKLEVDADLRFTCLSRYLGGSHVFLQLPLVE